MRREPGFSPYGFSAGQDAQRQARCLPLRAEAASDVPCQRTLHAMDLERIRFMLSFEHRMPKSLSEETDSKFSAMIRGAHFCERGKRFENEN